MTPTKQATLPNDVSPLKSRVTDLETTGDRAKTDEETWLTNRRIRYQEAGQWARHYSTVRMSVTTFLIGLSVTIVSFGWNYWDEKPRVSSVQTAAALWLVAVGLFTVFTRLTFQMARRSADHRRKLQIDKQISTSNVSSNDPASWAVAFISLGFAYLVWWTMGGYWAAGFLAALLAFVIIAIRSTR